MCSPLWTTEAVAGRIPNLPAASPRSPSVGPVRVFLAGATGVIGRQLVPLLVDAGHEVAGMTRSPDKAGSVARQGALPVVCDVYERRALEEAVAGFGPDAVLHQLTDLPDEVDRIPEFAGRNNRIRTEGTRNLLAAARRSGAGRFLAQSIAWTPPSAGGAIEEHERLVLEAGGVVLRYGVFYGPGTYSGTEEVPPPPRIHVRDAARRTLAALDASSGIIVLVDDDPAGEGAPAR